MTEPDNIQYPTDNEWGIPALPLTAAATAVPLPIVCYGSRSRATWHTGTTHYYTEDYRFQKLRFTPPSTVVVEPNYSYDTARASILYSTLRKRRAAWRYAMQGAQIIADLYIPPQHIELAILGLPRGWNAYAWRCHRADDPAIWDARLAAARAWAGDRPLLILLIAGGQRARDWAAKHNAIWHPGALE
jgi:hypothetical protein